MSISSTVAINGEIPRLRCLFILSPYTPLLVFANLIKLAALASVIMSLIY